MKIINFEDVKALNISPAECYKWASYMIANKSDTLLPPKISMTMPEGRFCNVMPSLVNGLNGAGFGGVKIVNRYPERNPALDSKILLLDHSTGEFLALMDGNWITAMRTGAVAAHSVINLAKEKVNTISMLGLGNVARATLMVLASQTSSHINIRLLRYKDQAEQFIDRFKYLDNVSFTIVDGNEQLIRGADVVISCVTYLDHDIASDEWFDKGVLVVPVHTRGFTNCDLFFDKVFADDRGHVQGFKNFARFRSFAEVSDVINGDVAGRENDEERILAYNVGVSIHDIYYAAQIYELYKNNEDAFAKLEEVKMCDPVEKFWI